MSLCLYTLLFSLNPSTDCVHSLQSDFLDKIIVLPCHLCAMKGSLERLLARWLLNE